jgi:actin-like ATPase involved in cell morphogenesis
VSGLLVISDRHNANKLKKVCCEYIRQHYSQVIETSEYREICSEVENILNSTEEEKKKNTSITRNNNNNNKPKHNKRKSKDETDKTNSQFSKKPRK